jgi:hypothetical protein
MMPLDFNHGSGPKAVPNTISDIINAAIDTALLAKRAKEPTRDYLGASIIGDECERKLQYIYTHTPVDPGRELTAKALRIFATGHQVEEMAAGAMDEHADNMFRNVAAQFMTDAGFILERYEDTKAKKQFGFKAMDGKFAGHTDGRLIGGPTVTGYDPVAGDFVTLNYPCGWECKGLNTKNWSKIKKHGVRVAAPVYYGQLQTYIPYMQWPQFLFTAFNKNTSEMHHEIVGLDASAAQDLSDKAVRIIHHSETGDLLARVASNPDFYLCKFCDWAKRCWKTKN